MDRRIKPKEKKKISKQARVKKPSLVQEWISLPATIRSKKQQAKQGIRQIQEDFILYRSQVLTYDYFATNTDRRIDELYSFLQKELKKLASLERELYFKMLSPRALRTLNSRLDEILKKQKELTQKIHKAPQAFDFYNRMSIFKKIHHQQVQEEMEVTKVLTKAQKNLESALVYIQEYEQELVEDNPGSSILNLKELYKFRDEKLQLIQTMEEEKEDPALMIMEIENLASVLFDAPAMAKWVNEVERRFNHLTGDHKVLVDVYGKRVIPQEIVNEFSDILYNAVPKLWASGQKEQLEQHLGEVDVIHNTYASEVDSEITFAERHVRREGGTSKASQKLNQLSEMARIFIAAMDARDPTMNQHSLIVARLAVATGRQMNWKTDEIQHLEIASLLHDVGKIWIPEELLTKKTRLSQDDIKKIRMHPVYGAQILESSEHFAEIIPWIYHHQELWNGSGYPDGLKEDEIPLQSRVISVCEAFSAMLAGTPVKSRLNIRQALDRIKEDAGTLFDPVVVDSFVTAVETQEMDYLKKFVEK